MTMMPTAVLVAVDRQSVRTATVAALVVAVSGTYQAHVSSCTEKAELVPFGNMQANKVIGENKQITRGIEHISAALLFVVM